MVAFRNLLVALAATALSAHAAPVEDKSLTKRGSVLTGQWDTESEARMHLALILSIKD